MVEIKEVLRLGEPRRPWRSRAPHFNDRLPTIVRTMSDGHLLRARPAGHVVGWIPAFDVEA